MADRLFRGSSRFAAFMLVVLLVAIGALLLVNSRLTWETFGLSFITGMDWDPVAGIYGAMPFIVGTILASLLAIVIAAPIGILTSLYLSELAPRRTATPLTFMIELLAAIPSRLWRKPTDPVSAPVAGRRPRRPGTDDDVVRDEPVEAIAAATSANARLAFGLSG